MDQGGCRPRGKSNVQPFGNPLRFFFTGEWVCISQNSIRHLLLTFSMLTSLETGRNFNMRNLTFLNHRVNGALEHRSKRIRVERESQASSV